MHAGTNSESANLNRTSILKMASKTFPALLFIALCVVQAANTNIPNPRDVILSRALRETETIVERVVLQVQNTIQQVESQIKKAVGQLENAGRGLINQAEETLQMYYDKINSTVTQLIEKGEKIGTDISQCIGDELEAEDAFPGEDGNFGSCVGTAQQFMNVTQQSIKDAQAFVQHAQQALSQCLQEPLTAVLCLGTHATQTATEVTHIVTDLGQAGQAVVKEVIHAVANISSCVQTKVQGAASQAQIIVQDVSSCVQNKIG